MFTVQLLSLVVQVFLSQMLNIQEALHNLINRAVYEGESQVTQGVVRQPLLEGANHKDKNKDKTNNNHQDDKIAHSDKTGSYWYNQFSES